MVRAILRVPLYYLASCLATLLNWLREPAHLCHIIQDKVWNLYQKPFFWCHWMPFYSVDLCCWMLSFEEGLRLLAARKSRRRICLYTHGIHISALQLITLRRQHEISRLLSVLNESTDQLFAASDFSQGDSSTDERVWKVLCSIARNVHQQSEKDVLLSSLRWAAFTVSFSFENAPPPALLTYTFN